MRVLIAKAVLPVAAPPLLDGAAVALEDGRIAAVGKTRDVVRTAGTDAPVTDLGDVAIVPGLVNAHVHLELSWLTDRRPPGGDPMTWLRDLVTARDAEDPERAAGAAEEQVRFLQARGTAAVGEVANGPASVAAVAASRMLGVVFLEIYRFRASDAERVLKESVSRLEQMEDLRDRNGGRDRLDIVLSPHAAHTTSGPLLKALAGRAKAAGSRLTIHVAESEPEIRLLASGDGPLPEFYRERGVWDDGWTCPKQSPVEYLDRLGVLSERTLAVHCVHLSRQDLSRLQSRQVTVVACPRSNAHLGAGTAPVPKILSSGVPVALGTDSLASAPDLDLFAEMAALRADHPGLAPAAVLRMATLNGARALGLADRLGSIEPDRRAALAAVPLSPGDEPLEAVTSGPADVIPLGVLAADAEGVAR